MIITGLWNHFKHMEEFVDNFWASLKFIGTLQRNKEEEEYGFGRRRKSIQAALRLNYCKEILNQLDELKMHSLSYTYLILDNIMVLLSIFYLKKKNCFSSYLKLNLY